MSLRNIAIIAHVDHGKTTLVDQLLASPAYGERWGRHWLDVAGYADSEGFNEQDTERKHAWKFRDYVIQALNAITSASVTSGW